MILDFSSSALIEIDVQNDFCPPYTGREGEKHPSGALAVGEGGEVTGPLNILAVRFAREGGKVVATQDWHPADHCSFASAHPGTKNGDTLSLPGGQAQVLWPDHCVQGSGGAAFHDLLLLQPVNLILRKGFRRGLDSYSAFFENDRTTPTGLTGYLNNLEITTVVLGGLATDYCVLYSALDAVTLGYKTLVLLDAVRGVEYPRGSVEQALERMESAGIDLINSGELL
jgi:nicotinamidase/pyrazinamidase